MRLLRGTHIDSLMVENHKLALAEGALLDDAMQYHRLIGRLMYLSITCLKLNYVVHVLSQFMQRRWVEYANVAI